DISGTSAQSTPRKIIESKMFPLPADMSDDDAQRAAKQLNETWGFRDAQIARTGDGERLMSVQVERTSDDPRTSQVNWVKDGEGKWHSTVSYVTPSLSPTQATLTPQPTRASEQPPVPAVYGELSGQTDQPFAAPPKAVPVNKIPPTPS